MSLQPIISSMLIDFDDQSCTPAQKAYQKQVYSAIKLNMSDIQQYQIVPKFTQCTRCKMILTDKDKGHVFDFQEVQSNPTDFKQQCVQQLRQNKFTKVLWICAFCNHNNLINTADIRFSKNRTRVLERQKMDQKRDPIILIVFDVSGSMEQLIEDNAGKNQNWPHLQKIKQTKIYKKIVADQQKQLEDLIKSQTQGASLPKDSKCKYIDYLKKNKLLMGLTEYLISKINPKKASNAKQANKKINDFCNKTQTNKKKSTTKTIGFMFFNSNLILTLDHQKTTRKILLVDSNSQGSPSIAGCQKQAIDFDSFETLFKTGQKYGGQYNTKISNFDFESLDFKSLSNYTQGQTALGPAIVTALGVISQHGQGSSIVVVTDGIGNKGIFDQTQPWDQGYKLLKMRLQKFKCFMTVLQFRKLNQKNKMKEQEQFTGLDKFCQRHNDSVVRKINVILNDQKGSNTLDDIQKKMKVGIDRQNCYFANDVFIKCQHPGVSYSKFNENLKGKLFNMKQAFHINPDFKQNDLKQKDYLHQFMTQIVIKYQNTQTGQQSVFMSYIIQKFIKYTKMKPKDLKSLDNQNTFMNIIQYLHSQEQQLNLDNLPLGLVRQTFRKTLCLTPIAQKTLRFTHKEHNETQAINSYELLQNMRRLQQQAFQALQKKKIKAKPKKVVTKKTTKQQEPQKKQKIEQKIKQPKQQFIQTKQEQKAKEQKSISYLNEDDDQSQQEYISL